MLVELALQIANDHASSDVERSMIESLSNWWKHEAFPGTTFDLEERFPTIDERKFWARCFSDIGYRVFRREIGDQENRNTAWQTRTIGDSYIIARMLIRSVQEVETGWHPNTEESAEAAELMAKLNLKI